MHPVVSEVLAVVREAVGDRPRALQKPPVDWSQYKPSLERTMVPLFEQSLARYCRVKHCVALSSGTAAIQLALLAAGVRVGDEVFCPSLTFAASANAIVHAGAIPHFVDVNIRTLGVHPFKLTQYIELTEAFEWRDGELYHKDRRVSAIVPVHLLGNGCDIWALKGIAEGYKLKVIEDATEAFGSMSREGYPCGTLGDAGVLSFNLNKVITTGGGGAIITNDDTIAQYAAHMANQAKVRHPFLWDHDAIGFNHRMSPLCAALGLQQMDEIEETLAKKFELWASYVVACGINPSANFSLFKAELSSNNWLNAILLDSRCMKERDNVIQALLDAGYEARALFTPLHMLEPYKHFPRQPHLDASEDLFRRMICLPSSVEA